MKPGPKPRPMSPDLAAALRHYRVKARLTQATAAKRSGYSVTAIRQWE